MKNNTTIWFLHGAFGMAVDWRFHTKIMADAGYATRAVDLWRFHDCQSLTLPETAAALNAEVAACEGRHIIVGYSMGGRIALHAILDKKSPWIGGVVISAHPGLADEEEKRKRRESDAEWSLRCLHTPWDELLEQWSSQVVLRCRNESAWGDRKNLESRKGPVARSFVQWSLGTQDDLRESLAGNHMPLLWLTGGNDQKFSTLASKTCANLPAIQHEVFPDCGHRLPWENVEGFCRRLIRFCDETLGLTSPQGNL